MFILTDLFFSVSFSSPSTKMSINLQRKADRGQGLVRGLALVATAAQDHAHEDVQGHVQEVAAVALGHVHEEDQGLLGVFADQGLALPDVVALDQGMSGLIPFSNTRLITEILPQEVLFGSVFTVKENVVNRGCIIFYCFI